MLGVGMQCCPLSSVPLSVMGGVGHQISVFSSPNVAYPAKGMSREQGLDARFLFSWKCNRAAGSHHSVMLGGGFGGIRDCLGLIQ